MKVLVVGGGGREHAICWKLAESPKVDKLYCAPGNAGIASVAECVPIGAKEIQKLADWAQAHAIDLTVVGMDDPLVMGIVDEFESRGLRVFGPRANAAIIEGSKVFSKNLMKQYGIPTAKAWTFTDPQEASSFVSMHNVYPIVLKADGLALGKGVLICGSREEALSGIQEIMVDKKFGAAGASLVVEEFLTGQEVSVLSFCDGKTIRPMVSAQDHKRAFDNDQGLNTGGMGAVAPTRFYTKAVQKEAEKKIFQKTVDAMAAEGRPFKGVLYFGLMLTDDGPRVLEYNCRFGDPEAQVVLPLLKTDLVDVMNACIDGTLDQLKVEWKDEACACVVLASGGYPTSYQKGYPIEGLHALDGNGQMMIFHAGTAFNERGDIVTNGGRVLDITATAPTLDQALAMIYQNIDQVTFQNAFYRHDIGRK